VEILQGIRDVDIRIVSGGQTGVDRGALDAAIRASIPHGGYCPAGRKAEDGVIPAVYELEETESDRYPPRTAMNVRQAHGTLLLVRGRPGLSRSRGTKLTLEMCIRQEKPWHAADPRRDDLVGRVAEWVRSLETDGSSTIVNVAGPRESKEPGIHDEVVKFLSMVFKLLS
jgi:hypothetical protein